MDARAENTFDSVISRHGLMFVPNVKQAFKEIYRVLKKRGFSLV
ncbi:methyltransferase domain-containing protein [Heyndrickxia shackletonii]|nr:methyltransferase domain-containing protein [Bacillus sp. APMAM]NEZ02084.1 class I SAM-dependent methyltransferase [Heyndrickxia shackletonii]RTZ53516.1 class I SAM-dependent methyltransferase [Bacillus sp. SAJ1]